MKASIKITTQDGAQYFLPDTDVILQKVSDGEAIDIYAGFGISELASTAEKDFFRIIAKNNSPQTIDFESISNCSVDVRGLNYSWDFQKSDIILKYGSLVIESNNLRIN